MLGVFFGGLYILVHAYSKVPDLCTMPVNKGVSLSEHMDAQTVTNGTVKN